MLNRGQEKQKGHRSDKLIYTMGQLLSTRQNKKTAESVSIHSLLKKRSAYTAGIN